MVNLSLSWDSMHVLCDVGASHVQKSLLVVFGPHFVFHRNSAPSLYYFLGEMPHYFRGIDPATRQVSKTSAESYNSIESLEELWISFALAKVKKNLNYKGVAQMYRVYGAGIFHF